MTHPCLANSSYPKSGIVTLINVTSATKSILLRSMNKQRKRAKRLFLLASALVTLPLLIEVAFRLSGSVPHGNNFIYIDHAEPEAYLQIDSLTGYRNKSGEFRIYNNAGCHFTATHNEQGRITSSLKKPDHYKKKIILYGCSFFYGQGIDDTATVGWKLQTLLPGYQVISRAFPGYSNLHSLLLLEQDLARLNDSDIVVFSYASFHQERNTLDYSFRKKMVSRSEVMEEATFPFGEINDQGQLMISRTKYSYPALPLRSYSAFVSWLEDNRNASRDKKRNKEKVTNLIFKRAQETCEQHNLQFLVADILGDPETTQFLNALSDKDIPTVDVSVDLGANEYNSLPCDPHPNGNAHSIYAKKLITYLTKTGFIS